MASNKKQRYNNKIVLFFAILALIYLLARYMTSSMNSVRTATAVSMTVADDVSATGYFVRDEQIVPSGSSDTVEYTVNDGEKVFRGAELATEYTDKDALEINRKISSLKSNIKLLSSVKENDGDFSDVAKLDQLIFIRMNELSAMVDSNNISGLSGLASDLRALTLKRSSNGKTSADVAEEIKKLQNEVWSLQNNIKGKTHKITSPASGYFSETVDGYEDIFRSSEISDYTVDKLKKLSEQTPKQYGKETMGKIINGFSWYFVAAVPINELADLKKNESVKLHFSQVSSEVPATVSEIKRDAQSGQALVILQSMMMDEKIVSMRKQSVDIVRRTYTGLKVPKEAIRMNSGQMGVYVLNGAVSKFKTIKPIYEGDNFYIIEQSIGNKDSVVAMDDIIIKAKELEDKKVVK